jgi:hypothetical protein
MPTPVPELIAGVLLGRLSLITTANGYAFTLTECVRPTRGGENWQRKHLGIGLLQTDSERVPELDCPGNPPAVAYSATFEVQCVCKDSETSTAAHATSENEMAAAAVKAITNASQWETMGGYAVDSMFGTHEPYRSPEGEMNGVKIPVIVTFRVSENNPFEVRA